MKKIVGMLLLMLFAACSQEQEPMQHKPEHRDMPAHVGGQQSAVKPVPKATAQDKVQQTATVHTTAMDTSAAVEAKASKPAPVANQTAESKAASMPQKAVVEAQPKEVAQAEAAKTAEVVPALPAGQQKVVAPLVQGKGPIKSTPDPAPSNIMFKSEPGMDIAKANALTKRCKACHATDKEKSGPSWKKIQAAYGSADALAAVFASGFAVEDRKLVAMDAKFKKTAKTMTVQYKSQIKKQVEKGKLTYHEMAQAIFAK